MTADNLMGADRQFYDTFSEYMKLSLTSTHSLESDMNELHHQLMNMVVNKRVSSLAILKTAHDIFFNYPTLKSLLIYIMRDIIDIRKTMGEYDFPEFFWLVIESDFLSEKKVYDITPVMCDIAGKNLWRGYLISYLLTADETEYGNLVMAFHYTGHTVETLRIITEIIPDTKLELYEYLYLDSFRLLHDIKVSILSDNEKKFLKTFFEGGLTSKHPRVIKVCEKALAILAKLFGL